MVIFPALFDTWHLYFPPCFGFNELKVTSKLLDVNGVMPSGMYLSTLPSLYHITVGFGLPLAVHTIFIL